jgi:hypothetical protein
MIIAIKNQNCSSAGKIIFGEYAEKLYETNNADYEYWEGTLEELLENAEYIKACNSSCKNSNELHRYKKACNIIDFLS